MSHSPHYFVHEFRVVMVVENVEKSEDALSWLDTRLNGGDATFFPTVLSAPKVLTAEESRAFYETTTKLPARFEQAASTCAQAAHEAATIKRRNDQEPTLEIIVRGKSGAGKTTIAHLIRQVLSDVGLPAGLIDGGSYRLTDKLQKLRLAAIARHLAEIQHDIWIRTKQI